MTTLANLKATRLSKGVTAPVLASITGIEHDRIKELESLTVSKRSEPWLDEAALLSRALCTEGITPLITSDNLTACDLGLDVGGDLDAYRAGLRIPLSSACRIAVQLGLPDPELLIPDTLHRQVWDVLNATERHPEAAGWCAWCGADIFSGKPHLPTCLPDNLWGRDYTLRDTITATPRPERAGNSGLSTSGKGWGLKAFRNSLNGGEGVTQRELADAVDIDRNHYARMERCELPLTLTNARRMASHWRVDVDTFYRKPGEDDTNSAAGDA